MPIILTNRKPNPTLQKVIILFSLVIFILSLTKPAFYIDRPDNPEAWSNSLLIFLLGWMSVFGGNIIALFFWLANPIYFLSILLTLKKKKWGLYLSIIATVISLSFSLLPSIMTDEAGNFSEITSLELGYKFWLLSLLIMTLGTVFNNYKFEKG
jgi:hypothetical protein